MKPGDIIEFDAGDDHLLAVITRELGQKFIVVTETGDEMRPTPDEVTYEYGRSIDASLPADSIQSRLESLRHDLETVADEIDVGFLWEFVQDQNSVSAEELAELFFESSEPGEVLPVMQKLRDDPLYFKAGRGGFEPRSSEQVAEIQRQLEAKREKERRRNDFVEGVVEILSTDHDRREELAEEKMGEQEFRVYANTLQNYAIYDKEHDERDEAIELLDDIEESLGRQIKGSYGRKAFWLMVEMGVWDEHENLWLHRYNLESDPKEEVVEAVDRLDDKTWEPEPWRRDLTDRNAFSVDDASTLDIDDALSCRRLPSGGWEVGIHIADPSSHVEPGSPLDEHARARGTSIYLPWKTIPMFPKRLSEEKASLVADSQRPALSILATFNEALEMQDHEIVPSVVQVDQRLTYEEADALIAGDAEEEPAAALRKLRQLADQIHQERLDEGAVSIDLPDPNVRVTWEDGEPRVECEPEERESPAHELVSEFMILTNTLLGKFCRDKGIPAIFRSQESPDREILDDEILSIPEGFPRQFAMLRRFKPGNTSTEPGYHFGLGVSAYAQATSPIRRYSDLVTQRQVKAFLADEPFPHDQDEMVQILAAVETAGREAGRTQYETERYWIVEYLRRQKDRELEATMVEHRNHDGTKAAVWVHEVAQKLNARFRTKVPLGEKTTVKVDRANPRRDQVSLSEA